MNRNAKKDAARHFDIGRNRETGGTYFHVTCSACDGYASVSAQKHLPPPIVRQKFEQKGWQVDHDPRKDLCPDCIRTDRREDQGVPPAAACDGPAAASKPWPEAVRELANGPKRHSAAPPPRTILDDIRDWFQAAAIGASEKQAALIRETAEDIGLQKDGAWGPCLAMKAMAARRGCTEPNVVFRRNRVFRLERGCDATTPPWLIRLRDMLLGFVVDGGDERDPWIAPLFADVNRLLFLVSAVNATIHGEKIRFTPKSGGFMFVRSREAAESSPETAGGTVPETSAETSAETQKNLASPPLVDMDLMIQEQEEPAMTENVVAIDTTPRQPTIAQKRQILDALQGHYSDKFNCGYLDGMTDRRLAEQLKMPPAWIATIRNEFFGIEHPDRSGEYVEALEKLRAELKAAEDGLLDELDRRLKPIRERIAEIDAAVKKNQALRQA